MARVKELTPEERKLLADTFPQQGFVSFKAVMSFLSISRSTVQRYINNGVIPKPTGLGSKNRFFDAATIRSIREQNMMQN